MRLLIRLLPVLLLAACAGPPRDAVAAPPPIKHVFVVVLENKDAAKTFASDSAAPYLAKTLPSQGLFVPNYYGIGHASLDNYIAMLSGQGPNPQTQADCQMFTDFLPGTIGADGQALGSGCVYPTAVKTLADQLTAAGRSWKGYMEDMGADPVRDNGTTCAHPPLNQRDPTQAASATDQYATRHNPFVYFHSIIDDPARCNAGDVPLDRLDGDLQSASTTPAFSFITPDLCHDGHDATCADGGPGGLTAINTFLGALVPKITSAPAWKDSLLIVTFDEGESDAAACCGQPASPNTPNAGGTQAGSGGGRVGAVLLSPYIKPGTTTTTAYNHYSLLRSIEDLNGLDHLGFAGRSGLVPFGSDVYNDPTGSTGAPAGPGAGGPNRPAQGGKPRPACHPPSLRGKPRHLRPRTLVTGVRLQRVAGRRFLTFRTLHAGAVVVRTPGRVRRIRVHACRRYRVAIGRGRVSVAALSGAHSERRILR